LPEVKFGQVNAFQAAHVHVDLVRVGTRDIKRRHATGRTKVMLRDTGVEAIGGKGVRGGQQVKRFTRDEPMNVALLGANRAIALLEILDSSRRLERYPSAMASATIGLRLFLGFAHQLLSS